MYKLLLLVISEEKHGVHFYLTSTSKEAFIKKGKKDNQINYFNALTHGVSNIEASFCFKLIYNTSDSNNISMHLKSYIRNFKITICTVFSKTLQHKGWRPYTVTCEEEETGSREMPSKTAD